MKDLINKFDELDSKGNKNEILLRNKEIIISKCAPLSEKIKYELEGQEEFYEKNDAKFNYVKDNNNQIKHAHPIEYKLDPKSIEGIE